MKRDDDKPLVCRYCNQPIVAGEKAVRTCAGPMHLGCCEANRQQVGERIDAAIAEGTHVQRQDHFCGICRALVASIYHVGFDGTRMCPACADSHAGAGPASWEKQQRERQEKWERQRQQRQVA